MIGLAGGRWRLRRQVYGRLGECSLSGVLRGIRRVGQSCQWRVVDVYGTPIPYCLSGTHFFRPSWSGFIIRGLD